jgi:hypothetical protein
MVNCARGSNNDELADDCAGGRSVPTSSPLGVWRESSPANGADGRRAMTRDSMRKGRCTGYIAKTRCAEQSETESANVRKALKTARRFFSPSPDLGHGAVKRSTLVRAVGNVQQ